MNDKITTFLNSDLLEKYLLGDTTSAETEMVETYISKYPEVEQAYNTLQDNLEIMAKYNAVDAPKTILNNVLNELDTKPVKTLATKKKPSKKWFQYSIAASVATIAFATLSYTLYQQNQALKHENQVVVDEIFDLRNDIENNNSKLDDLMRQFMKLNNPDTEKYVLRGNDRAKNLKTVAYINPKEKTSMIDVVSLPKLPENQTYQIWAEVQDRMVNLGILDEADRKLKTIPYMEDALGLSITIEDKENSNDVTVENEVAEISLQKK
ncbi:anti-sigma factor [Mangrovimonas spongiae]|uniref:Anti-sigma factor n=1 Tax=Mangrovimonas spongiae TaxID=2494697 RepID=A0A3R9MJP3_9FLAO|nr:anti-sigma factor [Mangrovimonas spongiae]RSK42036.1 anti-sigma factor [Mangrovimonas spongiae]